MCTAFVGRASTRKCRCLGRSVSARLSWIVFSSDGSELGLSGQGTRFSTSRPYRASWRRGLLCIIHPELRRPTNRPCKIHPMPGSHPTAAFDRSAHRKPEDPMSCGRQFLYRLRRRSSRPPSLRRSNLEEHLALEQPERLAWWHTATPRSLGTHDVALNPCPPSCPSPIAIDELT